jgi:large subunit ribosomal protein L21e
MIMVKRIGSFRRKTRDKFKKGIREKGKISLTRFLQTLAKGDRVVLKAESAYQKGLYFPRFHGLSGVVQGKQGDCYKVKINDLGKDKVLVVHPVHLKKQ